MTATSCVPLTGTASLVEAVGLAALGPIAVQQPVPFTRKVVPKITSMNHIVFTSVVPKITSVKQNAVITSVVPKITSCSLRLPMERWSKNALVTPASKPRLRKLARPRSSLRLPFHRVGSVRDRAGSGANARKNFSVSAQA